MDGAHGMIDRVSSDLAGWLRGFLENTGVSLSPPGQKEGSSGVSLYLLELADKPPSRSTDRPPLQLQLRYLVTTWAEQPEEAQRLLGEVVFAAMERDDFEVDLKPLPAATWTAFGTPPQPSFMLCVPLRRARPSKATPLVRKPLTIEAAPVSSLYGVVVGVLGTERAPLAEARVELPALHLHTSTDREGRFIFATVPGQPVSTRLFVRARGREKTVTVDQLTSTSNPFTVEIDLSD
ncbi:MAG: DUF4255 domain-containing protein [Chloroflexota bacterium]|nr:DUF4255 domain-containing protein [Chloroflexota bacterium]